jgi:N-acetylglucosaminyl-diphospho-decaprenol L-rhamnosyltransferase
MVCVLRVLCGERFLTDLSIIIVSYNARADLERCLESLHAPAPSIPHEIIVVDNQSSDGSAAAARRWPDVKVIEAGSNLGFARGTNLGIRTSSGTSLLLLNSDTIVPPGAIDRLSAELDRHPEAAVIGPRLVDGRGHAELSFGPMLGPLSELRQKLLFRGQVNGVPILSGIVERATRRPHAPEWVTGACLLVRRHDAEAVGLLDERYFLYTEDVDFCAAIRARGRKILFTPEVEIVHLRGRSAATVPSQTRRAYRQSQLAFYEKHHPGWAPLLRLYLGLRGQL